MFLTRAAVTANVFVRVPVRARALACLLVSARAFVCMCACACVCVCVRVCLSASDVSDLPDQRAEFSKIDIFNRVFKMTYF